MFSTIVALLLSMLLMFIPGFLIALALLKKTGLNIFEIVVIGFIFGLCAPAGLTWVESYLMTYVHFFSYSLTLFLVNVALLTIIGAALCVWQGVFNNFEADFLPKKEHRTLDHTWVWAVLVLLMLATFLTRMESIGTAPTFFEFDPYFDMIDSQYILTYGQQLLLDPSAWPAVPAGTNHRIEPIVPYIEAFWYDMVNAFSYHYTTFSTSLMSYVGGVYPPITAALLVFCVFLLLYKEYNEYIGLIGAAIVSAMPVIFSTFIAGEQLVEPWGIFALFFFLGTYMLAVKNPKSKRLAVLAGLAFVANFLGAHYYTVTTGVYAIYMILQGLVDIVRGTIDRDFYKMNITIIAVIAVFYLIYLPYSSTLQNRIPTVLGVPLTLSGLIAALLLVAIMDLVPFLLKERGIIFTNTELKSRLAWIGFVAVVALLAVLFTPIGNPIRGYLSLSVKFTTPSIPLFMTVEEYIPTGLLYDFGAQGFGMIGADIAGLPLLVWLVCAVSLVLLALSILYRNSKTAILYMAIALPLMFAGFSEVKYLPHFGVAYVILFCVILGEAIFMAENNFQIRHINSKDEARLDSGELIPTEAKQYDRHGHIIAIILSIGIFFFSTVLALVYLAYIAFSEKYKGHATAIWAAFAVLVVFIGVSYLSSHTMLYGESASYLDAVNSALMVGSAPTPAAACNNIANAGYSTGYTLFCNTIQGYWLNAMSWIAANVGPAAPRVLAWWDYGDWINWFGHSNAVLRGDNANALEDYATAAQFVLGANQSVTPASLANMMNTNQTKYVLLDQDLISKWQALDFLGCVDRNLTSRQFAIAAGASQQPPVPYVLGTSQCEVAHDPQFALIPYQALVPNVNSTQQSINFYCSISNKSAIYIQTELVSGGALSNQSVCVNPNGPSSGVLYVYNQSGKKMNAVIQSAFYEGAVNYQGITFLQFLMIYLPNAPNDTITNAPSGFYNSNYYKGLVLGNLPGFTEVYPQNATGKINFLNTTWPVRIYEVNNYTGSLPPVPQKYPWIHNNYTMP